MGASSPTRPIRLPPADLAKQKLPRTRQIARTWFKVHARNHEAVCFSLNPTHRYSHPACPHPLLYVGIDPETCLWEIFGDAVFDNERTLSKAHWDALLISVIDVPPLHLCDLSTTKTRSALAVDLTALMNDDLTVPQKWGLAIQMHPSRVPAIKFRSRFTGKACLAIFERGDIRSQIHETPLCPLAGLDAALNWLTKHEVILV